MEKSLFIQIHETQKEIWNIKTVAESLKQTYPKEFRSLQTKINNLKAKSLSLQSRVYNIHKFN